MLPDAAIALAAALCGEGLKSTYYLRHGLINGHVLPKAQHRPSERGEPRVSITIARDVRRDLPPPPIGILLGLGPVLWTVVPEATVTEHGQSKSRERNIDCPRAADDRAIVDPKLKTVSMKP